MTKPALVFAPTRAKILLDTPDGIITIDLDAEGALAVLRAVLEVMPAEFPVNAYTKRTEKLTKELMRD